MKYILYVTLVSVLLPLPARAESLIVGAFSRGELAQWEEKSFAGHTQYTLVDTARGEVLKAQSQNAASGLFKKVEIDLTQTPYLNWSWRVDRLIEGNNEREKSGDDYPARLYVVVSGGLFFWKTRALNYVWSSHQPANTHWPNAFTSNARMVAVRSGDKRLGQWISEKRNVREDLKQLFGEEITRIDAIAIMSDSDNSGQSTTAYFGDISFSDK